MNQRKLYPEPSLTQVLYLEHCTVGLGSPDDLMNKVSSYINSIAVLSASFKQICSIAEHHSDRSLKRSFKISETYLYQCVFTS